jgi:hypothetical protein
MGGHCPDNRKQVIVGNAPRMYGKEIADQGLGRVLYIGDLDHIKFMGGDISLLFKLDNSEVSDGIEALYHFLNGGEVCKREWYPTINTRLSLLMYAKSNCPRYYAGIFLSRIHGRVFSKML